MHIIGQASLHISISKSAGCWEMLDQWEDANPWHILTKDATDCKSYTCAESTRLGREGSLMLKAGGGLDSIQ
jgi:hypothetical protein